MFLPSTKLVFVSGQGGAGKTTVACALATSIAVKHHLKVLLLVNCTATSSTRLFGNERKLDASMADTPVAGTNGNLFIRSYSCFDEPYDANLASLLHQPIINQDETTTTSSSSPPPPRPASYGMNFAQAAADISTDMRQAAHSIPEIAIALRFVVLLREAMDEFDHVIVDFLSSEQALRFIPMPELLRDHHAQLEAWMARLSLVLGIVKPILIGRSTPPAWVARLQSDLAWGVESAEIMQLALKHSTAIVVATCHENAIDDVSLFLDKLSKFAQFESRILIINRCLDLTGNDDVNEGIMSSSSSSSHEPGHAKRMKSSATTPTSSAIPSTCSTGLSVSAFAVLVQSRQRRGLRDAQDLMNASKKSVDGEIKAYRVLESALSPLSKSEELGVDRFLQIGESVALI